MNKSEPSVPGKTLETLARNFCREAKSYGFGKIDYLRYVNHLLEFSSREQLDETSVHVSSAALAPTINEPISLPASGSTVTVRAFEKAQDTELFRDWLTDDFGRYFLLSRVSGHRANLDALIENPKHILGVVELNSGKPIGAVAYLDYDVRRHKAELRKLIGDPAHRGAGLAKEATELWLRYGLSTLGLKKVYVNTLHTNLRNIKLNESLGFKVEGLLHNEALIDGKYEDVLRMGLWSND